MLMKSEKSPIIQKASEINYSYETIRITQSRIDKGLLAIPRSISNWFPQHNREINVILDNADEIRTKKYSPYSSSTNENRIGGLREWIEGNRFKDGDEIVIQVLDKERCIYRLSSEASFIDKIKEHQNGLDNSENEKDALRKIMSLSKIVDLDDERTTVHEYFRHIDIPIKEKRRHITRKPGKVKEPVPTSLRLILGRIYNGICQVCGFNFLKRDNTPYFEIHHLDASKGNHPSNLILVCANCHRQFEFAKVLSTFNKQSWLIRVIFNENVFEINQLVEQLKPDNYIKQIHL
ncbi:HNH endonuclease [candidate division LCP-89 bacterium B3_LCP]|uniref:HNH endonuclease n=1 Tax=candidate division LCP-89 bacterium B3_LCP TaxID=2012998 RepID=A0A532V1N0_UNCL8|nr:MAG: HNH endonuclease [candidate division LCP-89 bacterium B3_LCP]